MSSERRWPEFRQACLDHGVLSTLSLPLTVEERRDTAEEARRYTQHLHLLAKAAAEGDRTQHLPETGAGAAE